MNVSRIFPPNLSQEIENNPRLEAERIVYNILKNDLPSGFVTFYSCWWHLDNVDKKKEKKDGESDFIIAHPSHGMLFIEVKGGEIYHDGPNRQFFSKNKKGEVKKIKNPYHQVRTSKYKTIELLKNYYKEIYKTEPPYFNASHIVIFPESSNHGELLTAEANDVTLFAEDMSELIQKLIKKLKPKDISNTYEKLEDQGINIIEKMFFQTFDLSKLLKTKLIENQRIIDRLTEDQNKILSNHNEWKKLLVRGGAGTGKTSLAVEKATMCANEGIKTLILCFNVPLRNFIETLIPSDKKTKIEVENFHKFCSKRNISFADDTVVEKLLDYMSKNQDERYDAIIIDEGQDFKSDWLSAIPFCLNDYSKDILYVFCDDNQKIYKDANDDLIATLRSFDERFEWNPYYLDINLRNSREVFNITKNFYYGRTQNSAGPLGERTRYEKYTDSNQIEKKLEKILYKLINIEGLSKKDISIISATSLEKSSLQNMKKIGIHEIRNAEFLGEDFITLDSAYRFKGLENNIVILTDIDEVVDKNEIMYVAISRAKIMLIVLSNQTTIEYLKKMN